MPEYFNPRKRRHHGKFPWYVYNIGPWLSLTSVFNKLASEISPKLFQIVENLSQTDENLTKHRQLEGSSFKLDEKKKKSGCRC